MSLEALVAELRASRGFAHKRDIEGALTQLAPAFAAGIAVGDDCAAIPDGQAATCCSPSKVLSKTSCAPCPGSPAGAA